MADGHFIGTPLVAGVHGLGCAKYLGNLRLGQVVVFPKSRQLFKKRPLKYRSCALVSHSLAK